MHTLKLSSKLSHICTIFSRAHVRIWIPEGTLKIQEPVIWLIIFLHLSIIVKLKEKCPEPFSPRTHQVRAAFMQIKLDEDVIFKIDLPKRRTRRRRSLENIQTSSTRGDQKHEKVGEGVLPNSRSNTQCSEVGPRLHWQTVRQTW